MNNAVVLWFRKESYGISSLNNKSTLTVQELIDELESIKYSEGADTKVFLGEQSGDGYGRLTAMRITNEEYEDDEEDEEE